jgi:hypothetical protein
MRRIQSVDEITRVALERKDLGAHLRRKVSDVDEGAMIPRARDC